MRHFSVNVARDAIKIRFLPGSARENDQYRHEVGRTVLGCLEGLGGTGGRVLLFSTARLSREIPKIPGHTCAMTGTRDPGNLYDIPLSR
jgi:hypothetical protein